MARQLEVLQYMDLQGPEAATEIHLLAAGVMRWLRNAAHGGAGAPGAGAQSRRRSAAARVQPQHFGAQRAGRIGDGADFKRLR